MKKPSIETKSRKTALLIIFLIVSSSPLLIFSLNREASWFGTGSVDYTEDTDANSAFGISVVGLNEGNPVSLPLIQNAPFRVDTGDIDVIRTVVNWVSTGSGIDWTTLQVTITLQVLQLNAYDTWVTRYSKSWTDTNANSSITKDLLLGTDICKAADIVDNGWYLEFRVTASATVQDLMGQTITKAAPALAGKLTITWTSSLGFTTSW